LKSRTNTLMKPHRGPRGREKGGGKSFLTLRVEAREDWMGRETGKSSKTKLGFTGARKGVAPFGPELDK